jgi:hypothetical protein
MPDTYFPTREPEIVTWTGEFLETLQTKPPGYFGVDTARVTAYAGTRTLFVEAYGVANNPVTRTRPTIEAKNVAKRALVNATRSLVDEIQGLPITTNQKRLELGITERGKKPTPSPVPAMPYVKVVSTSGRDVTVNIQQGSMARGRPRGVIGANIMVAYGDAPPAAMTDWSIAQTTGKTRTTITLDAVSEACTVWISAYWFNGRKATGPASSPVSVNLGATSAPPVSMKINKAA